MYDVVIIGAGPHALSLLSRMLINTPDKYEERPDNKSLFFKNKSGVYKTKVKDNPQTRNTPRQLSTYLRKGGVIDENVLNNICVIDRHGGWMTQWSKQFDALGISHLRSTSSIHPDAFDLHTLVQFAEDHRREGELLEIDGGIRGSKFTGPFIVPSLGLFWDFCKSVVKRHKLEDFVTKGFVTRLLPKDGGYDVCLASGDVIVAKQVVVATGNIGVKRIPGWARDVYDGCVDGSLLHTWDIINNSDATGIHTSDVCKQMVKLNMRNPINNTGNTVVIVGGGLSSAHLVVKAAMSGADQIHLVCRSSIKVRQFDLELEWIGRSRFIKLADFYSMKSFEKRSHVVRSSRGGGSITPYVHQQLVKLQESGRLIIHEDTEVWECNKDENHWSIQLSNGHMVDCYIIWLATGSIVDVTMNPLFCDVIKELPINIIDDLPVLTDDLEWGCGSGLYVMGALGGLVLGPDALNLAGARGGASRIAHRLKC
ncbi:uncharacterized protein LOC144747488 [Ciona intestinalis]